MSCYGGPIETPNIDRIAADGARFHTVAYHRVVFTDPFVPADRTQYTPVTAWPVLRRRRSGSRNASGTIPPENGMLSEMLRRWGWNTYMVGKWHLCPTDEMKLAATRRTGRAAGDLSVGTDSCRGRTSRWHPDLVYDNHPVAPASLAGRGLHLTDDITDKALEFIKDAKAIAPDKPFFLYYAPGACHAPHHAPKEWIEKFHAADASTTWDTRRFAEQTLARQKELGWCRRTRSCRRSTRSGRPETRTGPDGKPFPRWTTRVRGHR